MRNVAGAHRGLNIWLAQRSAALVMAVFLPGFMIYALLSSPLDFAAWHALFVPLAAKVATLIFFAALMLHAWIGVGEIFIDYVRRMAWRLPLLFLFAMLYLGCLVWAADILWSVS